MMDISPDEDGDTSEFGPCSLPPAAYSRPNPQPRLTSSPVPEPISDGELEKEIEEELTAAAQPKVWFALFVDLDRAF